MQDYPIPLNNQRLGIHYFPDTQHYRMEDLQTWIPRVTSMGAQWLTLLASHDRAIPEGFLSGLLQAEIEPILHFNLSLENPPPLEEAQLLFRSYARWGVHYVCLFDQPNCHNQWNLGSWSQIDLVERFLDIYIPLAEEALSAGLYLIFSPLKPGGDYWDTAFLRAALSSMQKRGHHDLLDHLVLGAYAGSNAKPLEWGAGGPERWPGAQPYYTPEGEQDQRGFYIFDWYNVITKATLGRVLPIMLFKAGNSLTTAQDLQLHTKQNTQVVELLSGTTEASNPIPENVLGVNFWLLSAPAGSPPAQQAWFHQDGSKLPMVDVLRSQNKVVPTHRETAEAKLDDLPQASFPPSAKYPNKSTSIDNPINERPIEHYLLLPTYEWGVADWHLDVIRGFVKNHRPTVGFSVEEASQAVRVTILGSEIEFPNTVLSQLRNAGCVVRRLTGDGTGIASQLASLE